MSETEVAADATYQSAERVLALLTDFRRHPDRTRRGRYRPRAVGVHKSTASRLAAALERTGFLTRVGKRYRLGVEIIRLGTLALRSFDLVATMQPAMEKLSQRTGETVNLAVPGRRGRAQRRRGAQHLHPDRSGGWIGRRTRPHAVANGKVLLAYGALAPAAARWSATPRQTITSLDALAAELATVRRDGYATAVAELEEGLVAVAAPVFDPAGACVAALSISGPEFRMLPDDCWSSAAVRRLT